MPVREEMLALSTLLLRCFFMCVLFLWWLASSLRTLGAQFHDVFNLLQQATAERSSLI